MAWRDWKSQDDVREFYSIRKWSLCVSVVESTIRRVYLCYLNASVYLCIYIYIYMQTISHVLHVVTDVHCVPKKRDRIFDDKLK